MSRRTLRCPSLEQLSAAPELGPLTALELLTHLATLSLAAAWPELHCLDIDPDCDEAHAAFDVVQKADELAAAIHRYKLALAVSRQRDRQLPF